MSLTQTALSIMCERGRRYVQDGNQDAFTTHWATCIDCRMAWYAFLGAEIGN